MTGFTWSWPHVWDLIPSLLDGLKITLIATFSGTAMALLLGLVLIFIRLAEIPVVSFVVTWTSYVIRGIPLLIILYFLFFVLPGYGLTMSPLTTGIVALGVYYGVLASEIYRAGIESIPKGQWEAALSLNVPLHWMWRRIILLPAIRLVTPMLGNLLVVMFKDSALLSAIAVTEVLSAGRQVAQDTYRFIEPYTVVGLIFFIVSYSSVLVIRRLERWSTKRV